MNNTFSFKRFGWLVREILLERWVYFIGLFVIIAVGQLMFGYTIGLPTALVGTQMARLVFGAIVGSTAITIIMMKRYNHTAIGMRNTLLPVSNAEKWASIVLINFLLFWAVYLLIFYITDAVIYNYLFARAKAENNTDAISYLSSYDRIKEISDIVYATVFVVSFVMGWVLVFSTYVRKNALPLSIVAFIIFWFALGALNWGIAQLFFDQTIVYGQAEPFSRVIINPNTSDAGTLSFLDIRHDSTNSDIFPFVVMSIVIAITWVIYYFRLKETEI